MELRLGVWVNTVGPGCLCVGSDGPSRLSPACRHCLPALKFSCACLRFAEIGSVCDRLCVILFREGELLPFIRSRDDVVSIEFAFSKILIDSDEYLVPGEVVFPHDAADKKVIWKSRDTNIAEVENGIARSVASRGRMPDDDGRRHHRMGCLALCEVEADRTQYSFKDE